MNGDHQMDYFRQTCLDFAIRCIQAAETTEATVERAKAFAAFVISEPTPAADA